jgi:hypothetical protein
VPPFLLALALLLSAPFVLADASPGDPTFTSAHFSGSGNCSRCHNGLTDNQARDVSIVRDWSSTMMANSTRDPFWKAKVRSEIARNPHLESVINDKCSKCHAPMANYEAKIDGTLQTQSIFGGILEAGHPRHDAAMDGVSCTVCHQIPDSPLLGTLKGMSGNYSINTAKTIYGQYGSPGDTSINPQPMRNNIGYTPAYSAHISQSKLCASCHNLKTPFVDETGRILSTTPESEFPEQMPYSEWEHSAYVNQASCQDCHMSRSDGVVMASRPTSITARRDNFAQHDFIGANKLMLTVLDKNRQKLGVRANNFADTIAKTDAMLKSAATLTLYDQPNTPSALDFVLKVTSNTGHKLPSAFPSRRVFVHVVVRDEKGKIVFESGKLRRDGSIVGVASDNQPGKFEPHYDMITLPGQVQVYEAIMGDSNGAVTYTLLRGAKYLKDNRILPAGFDKTTASEDIKVVGPARKDPNFVGGSDNVRYQIAGLPAGRYSVRAKLVYQTLAHGFARDLFSDTVTPEVVDFKAMYDATPEKATVIASVEFSGSVSEDSARLQ